MLGNKDRRGSVQESEANQLGNVQRLKVLMAGKIRQGDHVKTRSIRQWGLALRATITKTNGESWEGQLIHKKHDPSCWRGKLDVYGIKKLMPGKKTGIFKFFF